MLKNKNTLIALISLVIILALGISIIVQSVAIKEMKAQNGDAKGRIDSLYEHIDSLNSALNDTSKDVENYKSELESNKQQLKENEKEIEKNKEEIKKYQEILNSWDNATPNVREAFEKVNSAYNDLMNNSHLYPKGALDGIYERMMDAFYTIIRSSNPKNVADEFVKSITALDSKRFDVIMQGKIDTVKAGGVLFPEDVAAYEDALAYYNTFAENFAVLESFAKLGFDKELATIFAMLDADEEKDLANAFIKEVEAVDLPITLATSLKGAMLAWENLENALEATDVLDAEALEARALLDSYIKHMEELATPTHNCADCIRAQICELIAVAEGATRAFLEEIALEIEAWLNVFNLVEANRCLEKAIGNVCPCPHN